MFDQKTVIVAAEWQVRQELRALGLTPEIVRNVAIASAAARSESLPVDPCSAPGTQAYIHGVRNIRLQLLPNGWEVSRCGNVEATVNHELGIQLCFQNVDRACGDKDPEAISGKGAGSRHLINAGQTELFPSPRNNDQNASRIFGATPTVWMICVSSDDYTVRAEVSCPEIFEGNQFEGFVRRLFVVDESFGPTPDKIKEPKDDDALDFDVQVTKK